jgi:hypothetical protein
MMYTLGLYEQRIRHLFSAPSSYQKDRSSPKCPICKWMFCSFMSSAYILTSLNVEKEQSMSCLSSALSKAFNASLYVLCGFRNHYDDYSILFHNPFKSHSIFVTFVARVDSKTILTAAYVAGGSVEYLTVVRFIF